MLAVAQTPLPLSSGSDRIALSKADAHYPFHR